MVNVDGALNQIKTSVVGFADNVRHPKAYFSAKEAAFVGGVKRDVQVLTTSEKGFFDRLLDKIKIVFGCQGTLGDVVHLAYCQNLLKKHVIAQQHNKLAFSCNAIPMREFKEALQSRARLLRPPVSDKMLKAYTKQILENVFGEKLSKQEVITLSNTLFSTDGYFKKAKVVLLGAGRVTLGVGKVGLVAGKVALCVGRVVILGPGKVALGVGKVVRSAMEIAVGVGVIATAACVGSVFWCYFAGFGRCSSAIYALTQQVKWLGSLGRG